MKDDEAAGFTNPLWHAGTHKVEPQVGRQETDSDILNIFEFLVLLCECEFYGTTAFRGWFWSHKIYFAEHHLPE